MTRESALSRLGLESPTPSLVYDFWEQRLLTATSGALRLHFASSSVHLLAIHAQRGVPQVVGTDRHYTHGAVELAQVRWDTAQRTLSGIGLGAPGLSWTIAIYVPEGFTWHANQRETPGVAVISYGDNLLRARLHFVETDRVAWSYTFDTVRALR